MCRTACLTASLAHHIENFTHIFSAQGDSHADPVESAIALPVYVIQKSEYLTAELKLKEYLIIL